MYIQLPSPRQRCSSCGSIDQIEFVTKTTTGGSVTFFQRCTVCGHQKEIARTATYPPNNYTGTFHEYTLPEQPEMEDF